MVAPKRFQLTFRDAAVFNAQRVYLVAGNDKLDEQNVTFSLIMRWIDSWGSRGFEIAAVSVCVITEPERLILYLGADGKVLRWDAVDMFPEHIDTDLSSLRAMGNMREIRAIGKRAYAVGMGRTVYRRDGLENWIRIDAGVRVKSLTSGNKGFNSIDGFDEEEIYAVGWDGDLWQYDGNDWTKHKLRSRLALHKIVCGQDGIVYAVGQSGVVVRGRHDAWEVLKHGVTNDTFWGACWFQEKLYASTSRGLFALQDGKLSALELGKFGKPTANAFYRLAADEECIWSVGEKQLIRSSDGVTWTELPYA